MRLTWHLMCCLHGVILIASIAKSSTGSIVYQVVTNEHAVDELLELFTPHIERMIVGTKIAKIESKQVDTTKSEIECFSWQGLKTTFNESSQMISLRMTNMSGTVATMDVTAKYNTFFGTLKCKGQATPQFRDWNFTFNVDVVNPQNDSCGIQLVADEDSIMVETTELELNEKWYSSACSTVLNAVDAVAYLKNYDVDEIVHVFPTKVVEYLTKRLQALIPSKGPVAICYHNSTMTADNLSLKMSAQFDIGTIEDMVNDDNEIAFKVQGTAIDDSDLTEILIIFGFGVIGSLCGCA